MQTYSQIKKPGSLTAYEYSELLLKNKAFLANARCLRFGFFRSRFRRIVFCKNNTRSMIIMSAAIGSLCQSY